MGKSARDRGERRESVSGRPPSGRPDSEIGGSVWEEAFAKGFQLAPEAYLVRVPEPIGRSEVFTEAARLLGALPVRLAFHGSRGQQVWRSTDSSDWHWRLSLKRSDPAFVGFLDLTAQSDCQNRMRFRWRSEEPWEFFGENILVPAKTKRTVLELPLVVGIP